MSPKWRIVSRTDTSIGRRFDPMMKESDNLCAEALFYQLAARTGKPYASRKEAMYYIERLIGRLGYDPGKYIVPMGAGFLYIIT